MGAFFKAKEKVKFEESTPKVYGYSHVRKCTFKREAGIEDEKCDKMWKDLNITEASGE